jgi:hypothetical protein
MANETTSTTLTEVIEREAYAASVLYFAPRPGLDGLVSSKDLTGKPTLTARFPIYDSVSATAIAEATDFTTNSAIDTSGSVDVTVSEHAVKFTITDMSNEATVDNIARAESEGGVAGQMGAQSIQQRFDADIAALFAGFNSSTGSNNGPITSTLLISAIGQLDIDNIPNAPRVTVLHPYQWRTLIPVFDDASVYGMQGQAVVTTGMVAQNIYGTTMFVTSNVATATVSSSTVYAGAVMHPSAIAVATKGNRPNFEAERDASLRGFELMCTDQHGEAEYRGGATTNGRGGAGVFLYSNSTSA